MIFDETGRSRIMQERLRRRRGREPRTRCHGPPPSSSCRITRPAVDNGDDDDDDEDHDDAQALVILADYEICIH